MLSILPKILRMDHKMARTGYNGVKRGVGLRKTPEIHYAAMQNSSCSAARHSLISVLRRCFGSLHLGRFLPKLGGAARRRLFFSRASARMWPRLHDLQIFLWIFADHTRNVIIGYNVSTQKFRTVRLISSMLQPEVMVVVIDTPGVIQVTAAALSTASLRTVAGPGKGVSRRLDGAMLAADRRGVTALEYGIVATFLCLSLLGIFSRFGSVLLTMFSGVTTSI